MKLFQAMCENDTTTFNTLFQSKFNANLNLFIEIRDVNYTDFY